MIMSALQVTYYVLRSIKIHSGLVDSLMQRNFSLFRCESNSDACTESTELFTVPVVERVDKSAPMLWVFLSTTAHFNCKTY